MRRTSIMTLGIVLIFFGIQLNLIETYVITPRFSNFVSEHASSSDFVDTVNNSSPFLPASFTKSANSNTGQTSLARPFPNGPKTITPPRWICWPILFLGTVIFLHGLSMRND